MLEIINHEVNDDTIIGYYGCTYIPSTSGDLLSAYFNVQLENLRPDLTDIGSSIYTNINTDMLALEEKSNADLNGVEASYQLFKQSILDQYNEKLFNDGIRNDKPIVIQLIINDASKLNIVTLLKLLSADILSATEDDGNSDVLRILIYLLAYNAAHDGVGSGEPIE